MRAAIAKATAKPSYFEERALAAQAAREKLLAEITARCEEKVRRAKRVAEENKERKAAEHTRLKEEMMGRLAEAARRRTLYQQNTRRGRSGTQNASDTVKETQSVQRAEDPDRAVKAIQRAWRSRQRARAVAEFRSLKIASKSCSDMSFEDLGSLLSEERALTTTTKLLRILGLVEANNSNAQEKRGSTRVFLSSFLLISHPSQLLSHGTNDAREQDLVAKAKILVSIFEQALDTSLSLARTAPFRTLPDDDLLSAFTEYSSVFHAWKAHDSTGLIEAMVNQFVELDMILFAVKDDHAGGVSEDYTNAIRQNQIQILARLKRMAGSEEALGLIRAAIRKARRARASEKREAARRSTPTTPRTAPDTEDMLVDQLALPGTPTTERVSTPRLEGNSRSLSTALQRAMTPIPSNREVSHEIQINGFFEIAQSTWTGPRRRFMETVCADMRQALAEGGREAAAEWTHSMAIMIREKLMGLVSPRHFLHDRIDQILDVQLIRQSSQAGLFSYNDFFTSVANIIAQLCSQGRDEAVKSFADDNSGDIIDRLMKLVDILDLMTLDHVNFGFRAATPLILERGADHEQAAFEQDLASDTHDLSRLKSFWIDAHASLTGNSSTASQPTPQKIYTRALVDLVLSANNPPRLTSLPENLRLDYVRLMSLRALALRVSATSAILLTTKIRLRRDRESQWKLDADRIGALDFTQDNLEARILSVLETLHLMPEGVRDGVRVFVEKVAPSAKAAAKNVAQVQASIEAIRVDGGRLEKELEKLENNEGAEARLQNDVVTEQVAIVVLKALREIVYTKLCAMGIQERSVRNAAEGLTRAGIGEFGSEVGDIVEGLARVRSVDWRAHAKWFEEIERETELTA